MDERTRTSTPFPPSSHFKFCGKNEDFVIPFSPSSLYSDADDAFLNLDLDKYMHVTENEDDHYVQYLFDTESSAGFGSKCFLSSTDDLSSTGQSWLKCARLDAIQWVLKSCGKYNFSSDTIFLFVTYFDRFLSVLPIDEGELSATRTLAVGCFSLAIKMEENSEIALKNLKELLEGCDFAWEVIWMSELIVLEALEWKMTPLSPFTHVRYFFNKFFGELRPSDWVLKAALLMMDVTREINLVDHRPSIVAAATVLVTIDRLLTKEELMLMALSVVPSWGSIEIEQLFSFYKRTLMASVETPTTAVPSNSASMHSSLFDFIESSSQPVAVRIKTKLACFRKLLSEEKKKKLVIVNYWPEFDDLLSK